MLRQDLIFSDREGEKKKRKIKEEKHGGHRILLPSFLLTVAFLMIMPSKESDGIVIPTILI